MSRIAIVTPGDTLSSIAARYYGSTDCAVKIARFNGITNPDLLRAGERLEIPSRKELDGSRQVSPAPAHGGVLPPNGLDSIVATFGDMFASIRDDGHLNAGWETENLATARIPFAIPLSWNRSQQVKGIYCHVLLAPVISELFSQIDNQGLKSQVKTFGGCFNYRPKRQSSKLSTHCWGIAIDLNPETNRQGNYGDMHPGLVALFRAYGFTWGGRLARQEQRPDAFSVLHGILIVKDL